MATRKVDVIVLGENRSHANFVRHFLLCRGFQSGRVRLRFSPAGRGSGAQYVITNYPTEVQALRAKRHIKNRGLVVVIDADNLTPAERIRQLAESLETVGQAALDESKKVAILVPSRNIESWAYCLKNNEPISEATDYKNRTRESDIRIAAQKFAAMQIDQVAAEAPSSLVAAHQDLKQFLEKFSD
jgi:hypothetical protein